MRASSAWVNSTGDEFVRPNKSRCLRDGEIGEIGHAGAPGLRSEPEPAGFANWPGSNTPAGSVTEEKSAGSGLKDAVPRATAAADRLRKQRLRAIKPARAGERTDPFRGGDLGIRRFGHWGILTVYRPAGTPEISASSMPHSGFSLCRSVCCASPCGGSRGSQRLRTYSPASPPPRVAERTRS